MSKKTRKAVLWTVFNSAVLAVAILGVTGSSWAWNIFRFFQWFYAGVAVIVYCGRNERIFFGAIAEPSVPVFLNQFVDYGVAALLAAFGHFGYAALRVLENMCLSAFYDTRKPKDESPAEQGAK